MKTKLILLALLMAGAFVGLPAQNNLCIIVSTPDHHGIPTTPPPPPLRFPPDCGPSPYNNLGGICYNPPSSSAIMDHLAMVIPLDVYYTEFLPTNRSTPLPNIPSTQTRNGLVKQLSDQDAIIFDIYPEQITDVNGSFAHAWAVEDPDAAVRMYVPGDPEPIFRSEIIAAYELTGKKASKVFELNENKEDYYFLPFKISNPPQSTFPTIYREVHPLTFKVVLLNNYDDVVVDGGILRTWHAGFDIYLDLLPENGNWNASQFFGDWKVNVNLANYPDSYTFDVNNSTGHPVFVSKAEVIPSEPDPIEIPFQVNCNTSSGPTVSTNPSTTPRMGGVQPTSSLAETFQVAPNPFQDVLHISGQWIENGPLTLSLISMDGKKIALGQIERVEEAGLSQEFSAKIDKSELASGIYVLNISCEGKTLESFRLVKQ